MAQFVVGDTVQLKSGGPSMTVQKVYDGSDGGTWVEVVWFDDKSQPAQNQFPIDTLEADGAEIPLP